MDSLLSWVIPLVSGAVGGVGAGQVLKNQSLGTVGNAISGIAGGGLGALIMQYIPVIASAITSGGATATDPAVIGSNIAGGGIGGAIIMIVVGLIKKKMGK
jgi:hypothetical protein